MDDLSDAFQATRSFFFPFDAGRWLRLALLALFVSGGTGSGGTGGQFQSGAPSTPPGQGPGTAPIEQFLATNVALIVAAVAVLVAVGLVLAVVASIFEFAFVEALRTDEVAIRRSMARHWGKGLRLFGFRLVLGLVVLVPLAVLAAAFLGPFVLALPRVWTVVGVFLVPVFLVLGFVVGVVNGFTTVFVVPVMVLRDEGVVAAWRRFWRTVRANPRQYAAYLVAGVVLNLAAGVAVGIVVLVAGLALLLVAAIPAALVLFLTGGVSDVGVAGAVALGVVALCYVLAMLVVVGLVQAPVQSFLRLYALFVLGDTDADLDLIPDRRRAVREA